MPESQLDARQQAFVDDLNALIASTGVDLKTHTRIALSMIADQIVKAIPAGGQA